MEEAATAAVVEDVDVEAVVDVVDVTTAQPEEEVVQASVVAEAVTPVPVAVAVAAMAVADTAEQAADTAEALVEEEEAGGNHPLYPHHHCDATTTTKPLFPLPLSPPLEKKSRNTITPSHAPYARRTTPDTMRYLYFASTSKKKPVFVTRMSPSPPLISNGHTVYR